MLARLQRENRHKYVTAFRAAAGTKLRCIAVSCDAVPLAIVLLPLHVVRNEVDVGKGAKLVGLQLGRWNPDLLQPEPTFWPMAALRAPF